MMIPDPVFDKAVDLGIDEELAEMLKLSVRYTHWWANRRFDDWLFLVEDETLVAVGHKDDKQIAVLCSDCHGDGGVCMPCKSTGWVHR